MIAHPLLLCYTFCMYAGNNYGGNEYGSTRLFANLVKKITHAGQRIVALTKNAMHAVARTARQRPVLKSKSQHTLLRNKQ